MNCHVFLFLCLIKTPLYSHFFLPRSSINLLSLIICHIYHHPFVFFEYKNYLLLGTHTLVRLRKKPTAIHALQYALCLRISLHLPPLCLRTMTIRKLISFAKVLYSCPSYKIDFSMPMYNSSDSEGFRQSRTPRSKAPLREGPKINN